MQKKIELSATALKYIAIIAMTIDHMAFLLIDSNSILYYFMRLIGRLTAPIMSYFLVEGFIHTKNLKKYILRILFFATVSQPFYFIMIFLRPPKNIFEFFTHLNVMFTLFISLIALKIFTEKKFNAIVKTVLIGLCFMFADLCDWKFIIPVWCIIFFHFRKDRPKKYILFIIVSVILITSLYLPYYENFLQFSYNFGVAFALIPLNFYNGKKSESSHKFFNRWIFYLYYPLHIFVIIIIKFYN